jgi:hypothetical protein
MSILYYYQAYDAAAFSVVVAGTGLALARRYARAVESRSSLTDEMRTLRDRVAELEAPEEASRVEVEHLRETREFLAKLADPLPIDAQAEIAASHNSRGRAHSERDADAG